MRADGTVIGELDVDGGACSNDLLMQLQADLAGVTVVRPVQREMTALGAAYLAGISIGLWDDPWSLCSEDSVRFVPGLDEPERARMRAGWRQAVSQVRQGA